MEPNSPTPEPSPESLLESRYGTRWLIQLDEVLHVWSAVFRSADGRHTRVLIARTASELLAKLGAADGSES